MPDANLTSLLETLAETQGRLQACEEIIERVRQTCDDFDRYEVSRYISAEFRKALGPVQTDG